MARLWIKRDEIHDQYGWFFFLWGHEARAEKNCRIRAGDFLRVVVNGRAWDGEIVEVRDFFYESKREVAFVLGGLREYDEQYVEGRPSVGRCMAFRCGGLTEQNFPVEWSGNPMKTWHLRDE